MWVLCNNGICDVAHILFECDELNEVRILMWDQVLDACPFKVAVADELVSMTKDSHTKLILNALNAIIFQNGNMYTSSHHCS